MSAPENDWRPACSIEMLRFRAQLRHEIRNFFDERGYLEVDTPLLSHDVVVDAHLHPFAVSTDDGVRYLQTSPEAAMKRLLAAGSGSIYQISHVFRRRESGDLHNPEFTMLEWYGVQTTQQDQLELTEQLVRHCFAVANRTTGIQPALVLPDQPFLLTTYDDAFARVTGTRVIGLSAAELRQIALRQAAVLPDALDEEDVDGLLNLLLAVLVEPQLGAAVPEFLCDYPASQAALARLSSANPAVAQRFELYIRGIELCNGYHELTDARELMNRDRRNNRTRRRRSDAALPGAGRMLEAMRYGLPDCSGVALGFDRLVMLASGSGTIQAVLPFPQDRA